jgi:hypothetical protein
MNIDWRQRFGRRWITSVRSQGGSENCWAFAMTALYEAMIRIEHCLWTRRSEGEAARGTGKQAWDLGNLGEVSIFVERYGLGDPDCFPWSEPASLYLATPHGPALTALPVSPAPDRSGRTMRIRAGALFGTNDLQQKRDWIDLVGPMAVMFTPPADFGSLRDGIYVPTMGGAGRAHALLVVGYNDDEKYWIVKNSWDTVWGVGGFGKVGYAANLLENVGFYGIRGTNPDPWAKRRHRAGTLVQSGNGPLHNNFELFVRKGATVEHWYRENADPKQPWLRVGVVRSTDVWRDTFHDDALDCPSVVQSSFNRNYELIYRSTWQQLRHVYFDHTSGLWNDATLLGPQNPVGIPGFVQHNRGAPGDFEVVVVDSAGQAEHWTKHNGAPWTRPPGTWYLREKFGGGFAHGGPSLVQSRLGTAGSPENGSGELHYVGATKAGELQHHRFTNGSWTFVGAFGQDVTSAPCLIEGTYGMSDETGVGNFELCVGVAGAIEHWWRHNASNSQWYRSATFGSGIRRVVSLLQGTYGANLELIAEREDGTYQHFFRDGAGWHPTVVIT